ncbi:hypothetical protein K504DRAFT_502809 [Pleomassaria siparia CBS 279.74]|uniref:Uncharacterized protein n=1 Tax=Pleomassaria siparia CBS 279.74 TaxID=1314801 RepID=A0A6G1K845_9PLEO|nr:hypothetical protein K504DRAFT_502809 [Pleomassaria siparia CBS 279.74]
MPTQLLTHSCGHYSHPATNNTASVSETCPCCKVQRILGSIQACTRNWDKYGGPCPKHASQKFTEDYKTARKTFRVVKMRLVKYMYQLSLDAELEREWDLKHPGWQQQRQQLCGAEPPVSVSRSSAALDMATTTDCGTELQYHPKCTHDRRVRFTPDTMDEDTRTKRPLRAFARRSPEYKPGRWTAPSMANKWIDTSFFRVPADQFHSERYQDDLERNWERERIANKLSRFFALLSTISGRDGEDATQGVVHQSVRQEQDIGIGTEQIDGTNEHGLDGNQPCGDSRESGLHSVK